MPTFIDLFAGAGGFSEGFLQAEANGKTYDFLLASDINPTCEVTHRVRYNYQLGLNTKFLTKDITDSDFLEVLNEEIENQDVDVVVGGPPCQAYSLVGRAQSSHMETPMTDDPRNTLYKLYVRFLKRYQPKMFVFENVMGIESANEGRTWKNIQKYLKRVGYEIECREQKKHN